MTDTCFVITPIGTPSSPQRARADRLCDLIVRPALDSIEPRLEVRRGDRIQSTGPITVQVVESITDARLIVADLADPNPNVYYELGIAESFQKPIIRFGGGTAEALPFDVRDMRTIALPKRDGGGIDVLDATRCVAEMTTLLPMMLAEDYRPASIVSLAERKAAFESLKGSVETGDSAESLLLAELARQVSAISARLQDITSVLPAKPEKPTPGSWFTVSGMIAGRDGWLSCRSCDYGESFEPALGDRPEATCPECGASSAP